MGGGDNLTLLEGCILCKVLEHNLASNIVKHLDAQGIMYDLEHGFMEKRSCEMQLVMMIEDLARNAYARKQTDVILSRRLLTKLTTTSSSGNCTLNME